MIGIIICTFTLSCFITLIGVGLIHTNTKAYKMRDTMFHRYCIMDNLWIESMKDITFTYADRFVHVRVNSHSLAGTNKNCRVYSAFINDIECATAVKLRDKYNCYYTFYVDEQFDEKEVWDILDTAHKKTEEQKLEKVAEESTKRSVLGEK